VFFLLLLKAKLLIVKMLKIGQKKEALRKYDFVMRLVSEMQDVVRSHE
jgi:hypothetical protein